MKRRTTPISRWLPVGRMLLLLLMVTSGTPLAPSAAAARPNHPTTAPARPPCGPAAVVPRETRRAHGGDAWTRGARGPYSARLTTPRTMAPGATFHWAIDATTTGVPMARATLRLSGCWTGRQVARVYVRPDSRGGRLVKLATNL